MYGINHQHGLVGSRETVSNLYGEIQQFPQADPLQSFPQFATVFPANFLPIVQTGTLFSTVGPNPVQQQSSSYLSQPSIAQQNILASPTSAGSVLRHQQQMKIPSIITCDETDNRVEIIHGGSGSRGAFNMQHHNLHLYIYSVFAVHNSWRITNLCSSSVSLHYFHLSLINFFSSTSFGRTSSTQTKFGRIKCFHTEVSTGTIQSC